MRFDFLKLLDRESIVEWFIGTLYVTASTCGHALPGQYQLVSILDE